MTQIPAPPIPGQRVSATLIRQIISCIRENRVIQGKNISISRTPNGTVVGVKGKAAEVARKEENSLPFDLRYVVAAQGSVSREWQVYLPEGSCQIANSVSNTEAVVDSTVNTHRGSNWHSVPSPSPAPDAAYPLWLYGAVEYGSTTDDPDSSSSGSSSSGSAEGYVLPLGAVYFVSPDATFADAFGNNYEANSAWRFFRVRIADVSPAGAVAARFQTGAVSLMGAGGGIESSGSAGGGVHFGLTETGNIGYTHVYEDEATGVTSRVIENHQLKDDFSDDVTLAAIADTFTVSQTSGGGEQDAYEATIASSAVVNSECSGGDCFAVWDDDGVLDHTAAGSGGLSVSKVEAVCSAFDIDESDSESVTMNTGHLRYTPDTGAAHGPLVLGVGQKSQATSRSEPEAVVAIDGLPASAVNVGKMHPGTQSEANQYLDSLLILPRSGSTAEVKLSHAALDDTSPWNNSYAASDHIHGNIDNDGHLTHLESITENGQQTEVRQGFGGRVVITDANGLIIGEANLTADALRALCNAIAQHTPDSMANPPQTFSPFVSAVSLKANSSASHATTLDAGTATLALNYGYEPQAGGSPTSQAKISFANQGTETASVSGDTNGLVATSSTVTLSSNTSQQINPSIAVFSSGVKITAAENNATLESHPTAGNAAESGSSKAIATVGWVQANITPFSSNSSGVVYYDTSANDGAGGYSTKPIGDGANTIASGDHTHSGYLPAPSNIAANSLLVWNNGLSASGISVSSSKIPTASIDYGNGVTNLTSSNIGSYVVSGSSSFSDLVSAVNSITSIAHGSSAKVPLSKIQGDISGHSGDCLVTIDDSGNLGHSGNSAYTLLSAAADNNKSANKIITDKDIGNGLEADSSTHSIKAKVKSGGGISVGADGLYLGGLTGGKWCVTNGSGAITTTNDTPVAVNPNNTGVLYNTNGTLSYKKLGTSAGTIAEGNHTHTASQVTDLGDAATKNVGTGSDNVAAGNHNHNGVYQPAGNYAALTASSEPVAPLTFYAANGAQQAAGVGSATEAARADHIHVLPATVVTEFGDQSIYGVKRFENNKLIIQAAPQGSSATMSFRSEAGSSQWAGLQASSAQIVVFYVHSDGNTRLNITDDYATVTKNNFSGNVVLFANGSLRLTARSNGASISFRYNAASSDTAAISESASGHLSINNHPTETDLTTTDSSDTAKQIATVGFVNGKMTAASPSSSSSFTPSDDSEDNRSWTAGGSNGLAVKKLMRTKYVTSGTTPILYAYYRTYTYDKFGRLYSVSKETREIVANTAVISWA